MRTALTIRRSIVLACLTTGLSLVSSTTSGQETVVSVAFGAGLNTVPTAGFSGPSNHHVIPERIRVNGGDIVNFVVAGFHQIRIYQPGVVVDDIVAQLPPECRTNPAPASCAAAGVSPIIPLDRPGIPASPDLPTFYEGISPTTPPAGRSAAQNRVESVSFSEPGRYLVVCTVLNHFNDGMIAWVEVRGGGKRE